MTLQYDLKENEKSPEEELNEIETSHLVGFKVRVDICLAGGRVGMKEVVTT